MQLGHREGDMARDDETCVARAPRGKGGERIIARHMRVDDLDPVLAHETRERQRARHVERVTQRQRDDMRGW